MSRKRKREDMIRKRERENSTRKRKRENMTRKRKRGGASFFIRLQFPLPSWQGGECGVWVSLRRVCSPSRRRVPGQS